MSPTWKLQAGVVELAITAAVKGDRSVAPGQLAPPRRHGPQVESHHVAVEGSMSWAISMKSTLPICIAPVQGLVKADDVADLAGF